MYSVKASAVIKVCVNKSYLQRIMKPSSSLGYVQTNREFRGYKKESGIKCDPAADTHVLFPVRLSDINQQFCVSAHWSGFTQLELVHELFAASSFLVLRVTFNFLLRVHSKFSFTVSKIFRCRKIHLSSFRTNTLDGFNHWWQSLIKYFHNVFNVKTLIGMLFLLSHDNSVDFQDNHIC